MKILWITNTLFPDVCHSLGIKTPVVGGWMYASATAILDKKPSIKLAVASFYNGSEIKTIESKEILYYLLPKKTNITYDSGLEKYWRQIKNEFSADIIHIHGTEYPHGLAYIKACGTENLIVSIQGLVSIYERYYYGGINKWDLFKNITIRDIIQRDSIFRQRKLMKHRGQYEKEVLKLSSHFIGRTLWDRTHIWANNPEAHYHFCNETLRSSFYQNQWDYKNCEKNRIFLSQANYPIKGLQQMILALPIILKQYPNTKVYVAGNDFINNRGSKINGFGKMIKECIKKNGLEAHLIFTGLLSEQEICQHFLKANVFVCPSSIENSSNSIGEAQLLGVPCVASYVGGIEDIIKNGESGLIYRFEEVEMLAMSICTLFSDLVLVKKLSKAEKEVAAIRHNKELNSSRIIEIYESICKSTSA